MENTSSNNSNNSSGNGSIADPILNMYRESIDAWQNGYNGYNDFAQTSRPQQGQTNAALNPAAAYEIPPVKKPASISFAVPSSIKSSLAASSGKDRSDIWTFGQILPIATRRRT